jgi:CDP-6-deoxy-D-xylo-4-hexulose-3-dehydrase
MLFAGNLVRQPAVTALAEDARAHGLPAPYRVAGTLETTDAIMSRSFWFGVYPGITPAMREYVAGTLTRFVRSR